MLDVAWRQGVCAGVATGAGAVAAWPRPFIPTPCPLPASGVYKGAVRRYLPLQAGWERSHSGGPEPAAGVAAPIPLIRTRIARFVPHERTGMS
ncbi:hypothetical protein GCM10027072_08040 [Streptomyces bullii]